MFDFLAFFDLDRSIYLNLKSSQILIIAGQKNKYLLDIFFELYKEFANTNPIKF